MALKLGGDVVAGLAHLAQQDRHGRGWPPQPFAHGAVADASREEQLAGYALRDGAARLASHCAGFSFGALPVPCSVTREQYHLANAVFLHPIARAWRMAAAASCGLLLPARRASFLIFQGFVGFHVFLGLLVSTGPPSGRPSQPGGQGGFAQWTVRFWSAVPVDFLLRFLAAGAPYQALVAERREQRYQLPFCFAVPGLGTWSIA